MFRERSVDGCTVQSKHVNRVLSRLLIPVCELNTDISGLLPVHYRIQKCTQNVVKHLRWNF